MAGAIARQEIVVVRVPVLAMANKFKGYKPEDEQITRNAEIKSNPVLESLKKAWRSCKCTDWSKDYPRMLKAVEKLKYSSKDVEMFSIALAGFQGEKDFADKAGMFLSALINNGNENDYTIRTGHLAVPPNYIGFRNTKNIVVKGDVGRGIALGMISGKIYFEGNIGNIEASMTGSAHGKRELYFMGKLILDW